MKRIVGIVVTYNSMKWVDRCVGGLVRSEYPVDIWVVDNHSTDGTPEKIESDYPEVELIRSDRNLGFAKGNNLAITKAVKMGYDYFFLLNHDAWVEPDTIGILVNVAESHPDFGIISPFHLNGAGNKLDFIFSNYLEPGTCPDLVSDLYLKRTKPLYSTDDVNAAAWLIRRELIETAGLFDPIFHMYGEDNNYIHRVHFHGFKTGITPDTIIYHDRDTRPLKPLDGSLSLMDQNNRMMVIILNPNQSFKGRLLLLFRKVMSDFIRNLSHFRIIKATQNIYILIKGLFLSLRYKNRYNKSLYNSDKDG